jgi:heme A synthase
LNLQTWIRQSHRWLGVVLTVAILANFGVMAFRSPPPLVVYAPLAPLALLVITGLYMFVLPYLARRSRSGQA